MNRVMLGTADDSWNSFHYLRVPESAMRWGAYVTGAGCSRIPAETAYPPHEHPALYQFHWSRGRTLPEFAFVIITGGSGIFESRETGTIPIPCDSLFILFPGVWHRYRPLIEQGWTERWVELNGELVHRLAGHYGLTPASPVHPLKDVQKLITSFDDFYASAEHAPTEQSIPLVLRAMALVSTALAHADLSPDDDATTTTRETSMEDPLVARAIELIWTQSHRSLCVSQISAQLGVSRRTVERRVRNALGHSVLEEIQACRLSRAKRLLEETDLPIKTIASLAGFANVERLRVAMVRAEEQSPSEFRLTSRVA